MPTQAFPLFKRTFPQLARFTYLNEIRKELKDCRTCLDIGCGIISPVRHLGFDLIAGVDGHKPSLDEAKKNRTHNEFYLSSVQEIGKHFAAGQFDCCIALDLIEHLTKDDGLKLIHDMERIASQKIVLFTPNGFMPQQSNDGDLQEHLSGWTVDEMRLLGFKVLGTHGHKFFRGLRHHLRFHPKPLFEVVSEATQYLYTRSHPESAAAMLCIKDVRGKSR